MGVNKNDPAKIALAVRPGGLLVLSDCRAPKVVRATSWSRLVSDGDRIVGFFTDRSDFNLVHTEFHPESGEDVPPEYYAHAIALYKKAS